MTPSPTSSSRPCAGVQSAARAPLEPLASRLRHGGPRHKAGVTIVREGRAE